MLDIIGMISDENCKKEITQIKSNIRNNLPVYVGRYNQFIAVKWFDIEKNNYSAILL